MDGFPALAMPSEVNDRAVVHVVDDDPSLCAALEGLFDTVGLAARSYCSAREFLVGDLVDQPGCIVIDIRLPDINGLEFQAQLTRLGVHLPVVVMSGYGDIPMSVRAMKGGAVDFLPKPFRDQDMLDAVATAIRRDRRRRAADGDVSRLRERFETLSARERQVMALVAAGKMNKQVAGELGISQMAVKVRRSAVMRKMDVRTVADLIRMADILSPRQP